MAVITSFSSLVKSGGASAPKKSLIKIMPDFGESIDPYVEQAVRTLYDSVYELERRALALEDSGFITQRVAEKRFGAATSKEQLQVRSPQIVLNVDNLIGVLAQPQKTAVREVTALPPITSSYDGELVFFASQVYRFNEAAVPGGQWEILVTTAVIEQTVTANTLIADPSVTVPVGSFVDYFILQDSTGGWVVTWNAVFKGISALTVGRTADFISAVRFFKKSATQLIITSSQGDIEI